MPAKSDAKSHCSPGMMPWRVQAVTALPDFKLHVIFQDGTEGIVDMSAFVLSETAGVFRALRDVDRFNAVYLDQGAVTWPGDLDLSPEAMYKAIKQQGVWVIPQN